MNLTATEQKFCRTYGITPDEFAKEKLGLAALDTAAQVAQDESDERAARLDELRHDTVLSSADESAALELSVTDLRYCRVSGCSPADFLATKRRLASEDNARGQRG